MAAKKRKHRLGRIAPLFFQFLTWSTFMWLILLSITLSLTMNLSLSNLESQIDNGLQSVVSFLSNSQPVHEIMDSGHCSEENMQFIDELIKKTPDLDIVTIADTDSIRLYHVIRPWIGLKFVGDDQYRALEGESYISEAEGTLGLQRRAFAPVRNASGDIQGFVMASTTMRSLEVMRGSITRTYGYLALGGVIAALAIAGGLTLLVRKILHGFSPEGLVHTYLTQSDILDNLDEGLVAVDAKGRVLLVNPAAENMLGQDEDHLVGKDLDSLLRSSEQETLMVESCSAIPTARSNILSRFVPVTKDGRQTGATLILTDKSEAMRQAEQLTGTRHIISALRANTHEFMNKLQVISGLIQMGKQEEALRYIGNISATQARSAGPILQHIQNPNVAALLLGKLNNMRELDIDMTLMQNSMLPPHSQYLSTRELVTLLGNLLENAMEAINAQTCDAERSIVLQITENDLGLMMMVTDTGIGIEEKYLEKIFVSGFSTKASEGRGVGMALIRDIVTRHNGSIETDSEPGNGTTFTLIFHEKRQGLI